MKHDIPKKVLSALAKYRDADRTLFAHKMSREYPDPNLETVASKAKRDALEADAVSWLERELDNAREDFDNAFVAWSQARPIDEVPRKARAKKPKR